MFIGVVGCEILMVGHLLNVKGGFAPPRILTVSWSVRQKNSIWSMPVSWSGICFIGSTIRCSKTDKIKPVKIKR